MACPSCVRKMRKYREAERKTVVEGTLSAPQLTALGWQKTCVKCGAKSSCAPFPEGCVQSCQCT